MRFVTAIAACGLLSLGASVQAQDWSHARDMTVELSNFKFSPTTLALERGVPYRIHFTNRASGGHDFAAREFFAASTIAPEDGSKVRGGRIKLDGRESADVRLVPNSAGSFAVHCTHFLHSGFGMTGTITVR